MFTSVACHEHNPTLVCASLFLSGNPFFSVCLFVCTAIMRFLTSAKGAGGKFHYTIFFFLRRAAAVTPRCSCGSGRRPGHQSSPPRRPPAPKCFCKEPSVCFRKSAPTSLPQVQSPVLCTRRNPQRVLDPQQLFSRRANKCPPARPERCNVGVRVEAEVFT